MTDLEVPEPDAVEQAWPVGEQSEAVQPSADPEAPEADALEQSRLEGIDEEHGPR